MVCMYSSSSLFPILFFPIPPVVATYRREREERERLRIFFPLHPSSSCYRTQGAIARSAVKRERETQRERGRDRDLRCSLL
ncbi:hypothetical protein KP509_38G050500 [Ceratopteris richardii]|uniref:Secreted protein n=1 Tax=Ceratopteris richardii TaxID=49495 RepID=A0A8T2Q4S7_CERRI|nr:hypothetical protein KP509_38G050500 [Ceratopteris richardii]